jgi:hypothetical protein
MLPFLRWAKLVSPTPSDHHHVLGHPVMQTTELLKKVFGK